MFGLTRPFSKTPGDPINELLVVEDGCMTVEPRCLRCKQLGDYIMGGSSDMEARLRKSALAIRHLESCDAGPRIAALLAQNEEKPKEDGR